MVVNNTVFCEKDQGLFIYKETGKFFSDLKKKGNQVYVFQMSMKPEGNVGFLADYNILDKGFTVVEVKRRKSSLWAYMKTFVMGFKTIHKIDFVYLFYPGHVCSALALMSLICGKKFGLYIRGDQGIDSKISTYIYRKAALILTVSPQFNETIRRTGASAKTIRPMIDFSEKDIVRDREYKKKVKYRILFVGRIERDKGVFEIVKAVRLLIDLGIRNVDIHLVGDGVDAQSLMEIIEKESMSEFFVFCGMISDPAALAAQYRSADLFVLPTYYREGFPRVLYEAMIFGVPILTAFAGGISGIMKDGENCFELKPKNAPDVAAHIKEFLDDYENKCSVARNATQTIIAYLDNNQDCHAVQLLKAIANSPAS